MSSIEDLKAKLKEIFQLDRSDLDFGLYRIMNLKAEEVSNFIDNELLQQVKDGLKSYSSSDRKAIEEELTNVTKMLLSVGSNPEEADKVKELRARLQSSVDSEKIENEIYSDLYNFFKRYYSEGDFMSLRRYKEGVYALPYEGEEVKLHWANADQYYVKSGETLTNYTFKVASSKVRFEVIQATTEQNNNKDDKNRRFKLLEDTPVKFEHGEYVISFSYLPETGAPKQEDLNKQFADVLLKNDMLRPVLGELSKLTGSEKHRMTVLLKHLNNFTAKNTFDYFIHKDLGGFLNRELDFYIKNEIMHIDDIEEESAPKVEQYLCKVKVLRRVAHKIITFLASLEDFQKKIWLKKKFVLETNYCITLDRVPEDLYSTIITNKAQIKEWIKLFAIDAVEGYTVALTVDFLKSNPYLVLDTAFFDADFKYKLLASIDDFDEKCDGLLVNADNFQYLNLSQEYQKEKIKCIYIDPPYNTGSDGFVYKDGYSHSSWLSMMKDRLQLAKEVLTDDGVIFISIDDNEVANLKKICDEIFGESNFVGQLIIQTATDNNPRQISTEHEYMLCYAKNLEEQDFWFANSEKAALIQKQYEILKKKYGADISSIQQDLRKWIKENKESLDKVSHYDNVDEKGVFHDGDIANTKFGGYVYNVIHPITHKICKIPEKGFRFPENTMKAMIASNDIMFGIDETTLIKPKKRLLDAKDILRTVIYEDGRASTKIVDTLLIRGVFPNPKSPMLLKRLINFTTKENATVLDFFSGSATTAHAVINLNREDGGKRKYILVEMGNYFDSVTKPRIEKVIYSKDWKDGKPVSRDGSSHCFKYIRLESYEDALDNLWFDRTTAQTDLLNNKQNKAVKEEYMLKYMMDLETKGSLLNINQFAKPFDYELKITRDGETKTVKVDLVETFNYLLGLNVSHIHKVKDVLTVEGTTKEGEKTLILWRDAEKTSAEDLDKWFEKLNYSTQDMEFDTIYVNGNNNLENLRKSDETWKVRLIEAEFQKRMFDVKDV
jgi:adenine-specific DNA-methyltransferase